MDVPLIISALTLFAGLYMAWNIGANDVANAVGTSVGSKALTLKQAVFLAAILEFCGAFFLGSKVSVTIQQGIIKPEIFEKIPTLFALGMLGSLISTGIWLNLASFFRLPVSTTHAIVGAVLGFGIAAGGIHAPIWSTVTSIVLSWLISPLCSGFLAFGIFKILQQKILYALNPLEATRRLIPFLVFFAGCCFSLSMCTNGLGKILPNLTFSRALLISIAIGLFFSLITFFISKTIPSTRQPLQFIAHPQQIIALEKAAKHLRWTKLTAIGETKRKAEEILDEIHELQATLKEKKHMTKLPLQYAKVEKVFVFLQIISVCLMAFAHGSNDVANAIGPVTAVYQVMKTNALLFSPIVPLWILALGGAGIVLGLATWGWRVIETIGKKITELTPTRGFSAEFGAALTILFASKLGLPISTTHALVGAVLGVGLARGLSAINLKMIRDIVFSWIITIPICALLSIVMFYLLKNFV
ncbi:MAG: inorganic phosphate transporter [Parachlamydiales bacterium]|nr:inorganic phosphate transporter [Parachlamydiales bacterium]